MINYYLIKFHSLKGLEAGAGDLSVCILHLREHSDDGVRKGKISKTGMGTLVRTLFTIFTPLSISSHKTERVEALQEEIAGFLLDQVINPKGEFYYPLPPP